MQAFSSAIDKNGKTFLNKGQSFEGSVSIESGYDDEGTLTLKINGEIQDITLNAENNAIPLKNPYEYSNAKQPYHYYIDLNFYEIDYFVDIIENV